MIARLWWKELRTLWPAWLVLLVTAAGLQWFLLASGAEDIRSGVLIPIALCWAALYALVAASAAFAGEREAGTLGLLEALPVARRTLWLGKSTFVLASTLGLGLLMLVLGYGGSTDLGAIKSGNVEFLETVATLAFEAAAWGLLWSALLRNPMVAAVLALFCVGEVSYIASGGAKVEFVSDEVISTRLVVAGLALAASAVAFVGRPLAGWSASRLLIDDEAGAPATRTRRIRPRPASFTRALMWKAMREARWLLFGASVVVLGTWAWLFLGLKGPEVTFSTGLLTAGAALVAGVEVFGGETATGSQRFLLHLGVGPGPIWSRTMRAWGNALAVLGLLLLVMLVWAVYPRWGHWRVVWSWFVSPGPSPFPYLAGAAAAFAVGTLSGMVFRRRITAGMIGVVVWLVVVPLQIGLAFTGMMAPWATLLTPIALLGISRAWAGDWLDPRPGPARWLRLAGYVALPSVIFPAAYIAYRAWGVPDPGPVVATTTVPAPPAMVKTPVPDTVEVYRQLAGELSRTEAIPLSGGKARRFLHSTPLDDSEASRAIRDRIYQATHMPPVRFANPPVLGVGFDVDPIIRGMSQVSQSLYWHGRELLKRKDLAGAWNDILALYRMARQLTGAGPTIYATHHALLLENQATMLALDWAAVDEQTPELLRKALADLQVLPPFATQSDVLKAESSLVDRALDLPGAELEIALNGPRKGARNRSVLPQTLFETMLLYPSWERERARRICRAEFKRLIAMSPLQLSEQLRAHRLTGGYQEIGSPLATRIMSNAWIFESLDRATAGDRGLLQVIALRAWSLVHEGKYPESLDALVPSLLDHLPLDPFSGTPFRYMRSNGQKVPTVNLQYRALGDFSTIKPGQWLLFSVGPDRSPDAAIVTKDLSTPGVYSDDLVFPLP